ncbi:tannase/feruloyl esterase family alpha/beta hydrolase [Sphingomonas psychrotolerans]|uniref:Tannase/feruloyl esterase family alpha/beta hydrolase n=1 Tax=Sphingomonas psychrotolerans TaxID=1327635 RepID=A0ABU3N541_9SPHN|nr:tannase/feruloyl esterase family alpha/beta hydrolase [Sphingomonas psychrotolerans]MDT8758435.1 tannase/feruloyl esterase family alpha/beta hydrolase [Sphingomonas psychrotolerans]
MLAPLAMLCTALIGTHPDGVRVTAATAIAPDPTWTPKTIGFYQAQPVRVPLCRVEGNIEGNIGFELWLPADWNGRLLGAGVGGDAGVFNYSDMSRRVAEGFATVTTDSGHKQGQPRWMADPKARVDYEHRAVHLTALAAKRLAGTFYGKPVDHSYYLGCSGGGRQALKEMQNYPGDYDGVVAGAPGPYMPLQSVRMMWFSLQQKRDPAGALRDEDWALYERRVTAKCDKLDGVADGVIENPMRCSFRAAELACNPGQTGDCLTPARLAMLERITAPMPDEAGRRMDGGLFPGVRTRPGPPSPLLRAMWADGVHDDADWDEDSFRRTGDLAAANRAMPELRADRTAIAPFLRRGGKAILYQGWADPSTNAGPTIDYYAALARANGGHARIARSVRLFMVPGMYHCSGGPGADGFGGSGQPTAPGDPERDVLWALIRWVEQGRAPDRLQATKFEKDAVRFTRALCPFPASARYDGRGPVADATSWRCKADPLLEGRLQGYRRRSR